MTGGLQQKYIAALSEIFKKFPEIDAVSLFGSRAKGNYTKRSDIDLSIEGNLDFISLARLKLDLADSDIPYCIDIQYYNALKNVALKEHIDHRGKIIYQKAQPA